MSGVKSLPEAEKHDNLDGDATAYVIVSRRELEQEHRTLLERVQQLRRLLGLPALPTGKQLRRDPNLR